MEFPMHWLLIALVILLLFGGRKIPEMMRGMGEGIRSFKEGMRGDPPANPPSAPQQQAPPANTAPADQKK
ncbi:MAG: twin-arginine translocase TatA/TatE family subunit [Candidatus Acidiferrales bacterium]